MANRPRTTGLTYSDLLEMFPEETNDRIELMEGELVVTPTPIPRHQDVVLRLGARLLAWVDAHGGRVFANSMDTLFSDVNVLQPDVFLLRAEHADRVGEKNVRGAPDLAVEVSSPSTRRRDLTVKKDLYARFGVPEYWFVDLPAGTIQIFLLEGDRYAEPITRTRGEILTTDQAPGFEIAVEDLVGPADAEGL